MRACKRLCFSLAFFVMFTAFAFWQQSTLRSVHPPRSASFHTAPSLATKQDTARETYNPANAAPQINAGFTFSLSSINNSFPRGATQGLLNHNDADYMTQNFSGWPHNGRDLLFIYNPSIARLPPAVLRNLRVESSRRPVYMSSFRISSVHGCGFVPPYPFWEKPRNLLGLAILDGELSIIPGYEAVIDWAGQIPGRSQIEDCRLFVISGTLHLSCSWIDTVTVPITVASEGLSNCEQCRSGERLPTLFPTQLHVFLLGWFSRIKGTKKNSNFFHGLQGASDETMVELWPGPKHVVSTFTVEMLRSTNLSSKGKFLRGRRGRPHKWASGRITESSQFIIKEVMPPQFTKFSGNRGSACCIQVHRHEVPSSLHYLFDHDFLLVGLSHKKRRTNYRTKQHDTAYLTNLYAFSPAEPYNWVASSDSFCFGFPSKQEADMEPLAKIQNRKFRLLDGEEFDCPAIHFVSGITEREEDKSKVIIAYGVNDCVARMVEVDKAELVRKLFRPPQQARSKGNPQQASTDATHHWTRGVITRECVQLQQIREAGLFVAEKSRFQSASSPDGFKPRFHIGSMMKSVSNHMKGDVASFELIRRHVARTVRGVDTYVAFDMGANQGFYTYYLATLGLTVHAFEIDESNFQALQHGLLYNPKEVADRVHLYLLGISDKIGRSAQLGSTYEGFLTADSDGPVLSATFDCFAHHVQPNLQRVAFAKIDVEGFEIAVLKGAWRSLLHPEIHIGSLLMEVGPTRWKRAGISLQEGIDQMQLLSQRFQKVVLLLRFKGSFWQKCPPSLAIDAKLSDAKSETLDNVHMYMLQANEVVPLLKTMDAKDYDCNFWFENDSL